MLLVFSFEKIMLSYEFMAVRQPLSQKGTEKVQLVRLAGEENTVTAQCTFPKHLPDTQEQLLGQKYLQHEHH